MSKKGPATNTQAGKSSALPKSVMQVELDGLAVMKIIKHCQETYPMTVAGMLLGMEMGRTLEITNCYPFPTITESSNDEIESEQIDQSQFQIDMMRCVREVNIDHQVVGWYQSAGSQMGSFLTPQWIQTQAAYQINLHNVVCLIYDPIRTVEGTLFLKAYRISDAFMKLYKEGTFNSYTFAKFGVTTANILDEIPIQIRNTAVIDALIATLNVSPNMTGENEIAFDRLDESTKPVIEQTLDYIINDMDELTRDQNKYTFFARNFARSSGSQLENIRRKITEAKTKDRESAAAATSGEAPADTPTAVGTILDQVGSEPGLYHSLMAEPPRLETKLILRDLQSYIESITSLSHANMLQAAAIESIQLDEAK